MHARHSGLQFIRWFAQLATLGFLCLYAYVTQPLYNNNTLWCVLAIALFLFAVLRKPTEAFSVSLLVLLVYAGFVLYDVYQADWAATITLNDLIWLGVFPYIAAIGSIGKLMEASGLAAERASIYEQLQGDTDQQSVELNVVDERHGFLGGTAFLFKLEEEVLRALRERSRFVLLIVEIEQFRNYRRLFGYDQTQYILNQTAQFISILPEPPAVRGYLGEGRLAVLLPIRDQLPDEPDPLSVTKESLSESFFAMLLLRPRRESTLKIRLKFGQAECPVDGIEARSLLEKAQSELEWSEVN